LKVKQELGSSVLKYIFSSMVRLACHCPALNSLVANCTAQNFGAGAAVPPPLLPGIV
jgi:hypothetical protein